MLVTPVSSTGESAEARRVQNTYTSGETVSALKVVYMRNGLAYVASSGNLDCANQVIGIAITSTDEDETNTVREFGPLQDVIWSWTMGLPIYVGGVGQLTQTPPTTGFVCQVAIPLDTDEIEINIQPAILR